MAHTSPLSHLVKVVQGITLHCAWQMPGVQVNPRVTEISQPFAPLLSTSCCLLPFIFSGAQTMDYVPSNLKGIHIELGDHI